MGRFRVVLAAEPQPDAQVTDLFPNLGESSYEDWDYQQSNVLLSFMHQRILAAPDETRHIWKLDGPLEDTPYDETRLTAHGTPSDLGPPRKVYLRGHVLQASRSPGCYRFQRSYHSLDPGPKVADLDDRLKRRASLS